MFRNHIHHETHGEHALLMLLLYIGMVLALVLFGARAAGGAL